MDILSQRKVVGGAMVREAISDAAIRLLTEKGLESLTMEAVAEVVGIAKGTVYNYFRSKEELLVAVHDRAVRALFDEVDALFASEEPSAVAVLKKIFSAIWHHVDKHRSTLFILHECKELEAHRARHEGEFIDDLTRVLQRGIDQGELREQDARTSAWFILGVLSHACKQPHERPEHCPPIASILEAMTRFILSGIGERPKEVA